MKIRKIDWKTLKKEKKKQEKIEKEGKEKTKLENRNKITNEQEWKIRKIYNYNKTKNINDKRKIIKIQQNIK